MRVAVIGGGLSGLAAARRLVDAGTEVTVFEADAEVGGMARTLQLDGHCVDLGPHTLYPRDVELVAELRNLLGDDLLDIRARRGAIIGGRVHDFPFFLNDYLRNAPTWEAVKGLAGFYKCRAQSRYRGEIPAMSSSYGAWCRTQMGDALYSYFIEPYVSKSMGVPPSELPAEWAAVRVRVPDWRPLRPAAARKARTPKVSHYVRGGIGGIARALEVELSEAGCGVQTETPASAVLLRDGREGVGLETAAGLTWWDAVVSTAPLATLIAMLGDAVDSGAHAAAASLPTRSTVFVVLEFSVHQLFDRSIWYLPDHEHRVNRVYEPRHYDEGCSPQGRTAVCFEIHCEVDDAIWCADDVTLMEMCFDSLRDVPRAASEFDSCRFLGSHRVAQHYPLPDSRSLDRALASIDRLAPLVVTAGRMGTHAYLNMDDAMLSGTAAADVVLGRIGVLESRAVVARGGFVEGTETAGGVK